MTFYIRFLILSALFLLSACGQKGALYLPTDSFTHSMSVYAQKQTNK